MNLKRILCLLLALSMVLALVACGSSVPCENCGDTPTKGYKHSSDQKLYYCSDCSSECVFCGDRATEHYSSLLGVMFVCKDCYREIKALND